MSLRPFLGLLLAGVSLTAVLAGAGAPDGGAKPQAHATPMDTSGIITLYAGSDTRSSVDLASGTYGATVSDGEMILDNTHLVWNLLSDGALSVGYVRDTGISLTDLGEVYARPLRDPRARAPKFGASIFHTLRDQGGDIVYTEPPGKLRRSPKGRQVITGTPKSGTTHFEPKVGHIYLLRVRGFDRPRTDQTFKFRVIDLQPKHSLTLEHGTL